jgi:DNA-binding NarL/FixJ family response regulator
MWQTSTHENQSEKKMSPEAQQRTLLIIDDTVNNLRVAVDLLHAYGFRVLTASNGEDGLARALLAKPDLILLDIRMPGINGLETCRRLKANPETASTPVIFMTALTDIEDKVRGFEVGGVDYVTKPFDAAELLARVRTHLELHDLQLRLAERVQKRTAALAEEVKQRRRSQAEQEMLLDLLRQQAEQLREITQQSLAREEEDAGLAVGLRSQTLPDFEAVQISLAQIQRQFEGPEPPSTGSLDNTLRRQIDHAVNLLAGALETLRQQVIVDEAAADSVQKACQDPLLKLTTREYEVLHLVAQGKSNADIAEILVVSRSTVSSYRTRIMRKLNVEDAAELIRFVVEYRLG